MLLHVDIEAGFLDEALTAHFALDRSFPSVAIAVVLQVVVSVETLSADVTLVNPGIGVDVDVNVQALFSEEHLVA